MMNGIRIRPFEAAAILAALTLLTGCSLLKFSVDTGGEPLSKEETRMRLLTRGFYYEASDEVTAAADSIAAGSDDAELQRRTIRWKLRTTRAAVDAAMHHEPYGTVKFITDEIADAIGNETDEAAACLANVAHSVRRIEESRKVRTDEAEHGLRVIGALYRTDTGEVQFLE